MNSMANEYVIKVKEYLDSVQYDPIVFTLGFDESKHILGAVLINAPGFDKLFSYNTIYESILDIDRKIKHSILLGTQYAEAPIDDCWKPFESPSDSEWEALYYVENAIFRIAILWDLLAQLFNLKEDLGNPVERIYVEQLFGAQQKKNLNQFAKRVYAYMKETEDLSSEPWKGNFAYLKEYRNKMTHRYSPSITTISNYAVDLRMPAIYSLYRASEDYKQVSMFIKELLSEILNSEASNAEIKSEDTNNV